MKKHTKNMTKYSKMQTKAYFAVFFAVCFFIGLYFYMQLEKSEFFVSYNLNFDTVETEGIKSEVAFKEEIVIKETELLDVPFIPQAPFANWDVHENSCEEAAVLMTIYYLEGKDLSRQEADLLIKDMIGYQVSNYGAQRDLSIADLSEFLDEYYDDKYDVEIFDISEEEVKKQISSGNPVIVPALSKFLPNPYYPHPGYHMIDIIGYDGVQYITNDPGTKNGKHLKYYWKDIEYANETTKEPMFIVKFHE